MRKASVVLFILSILTISPQLMFGQGKGALLIKNATVMTASHGTLTATDILVENGKITKIGKGLTAGSNVRTIDGTGKYVTPGIVDAHSHTMVSAINEGSVAVSSMTRIRDMLLPEDIAIYRALAGGVTAALVLHGSANPIGGQSQTVKFKYGRPVEEFPVEGAPPGIKFALGENVKQSSRVQIPGGGALRYPRTRMGTMEVIRDAFVRAREYKQAWDDFRSRKTRVQPTKDEELEPLVEVLEGKRKVHCHGYRSDEHLNLLRIAEEFGFKVGTLQHTLEGYKIAPEIAKHGAGASIFADSWSYKIEAYDSIPYNGYLLWKAGVLVSINSDSNERMRRLNLDAAKMMKYGGVPEQDSLRMITLNPATQLGIEKRTGSVDLGKDGDLVVWSAHPFSPYTVAEYTIIEGDIFFDRAADRVGRESIKREREALEKLDVNRAPGTGGTPPRVPTERVRGDLDDADREGGNN